jgi:ribose-phosphate pyrophosphokinase
MGSTLAEHQASAMRLEMRSLKGMKLFAGNAHPELAQRVADHLEIALGRMTTAKFADGEILIKVDESARGNDVFILQPTCCPTNDNIMELMIMLDAFRRASASRITVVMPYYGYARQDKKIKPREPITARLVADMVTMAGANRVVALDLHADQIQGFFNVPVDHLYGGPIIGKHLVGEGLREADDVVVVSPDVGGVGRAKALSEMLDAPLVIISKRRPEVNKVEVLEIIGKFEGKRCVMIDDMIDTGGSIVSGAHALLDRGASEVIATCTHPVFSGNASERLQSSRISQVICLDTIPLGPEKQFEKLTVLHSAPLIGEAIRRIYLNESVSSLFHDWR